MQPTGIFNRVGITSLALAGFMLASCDDTVDIGTQQAVMELDPQMVDFGNVQVGTMQQRTVFVKNTGNGPLRLEGLAQGQPFSETYMYDLGDTVVPPNGSTPVVINFSPVELGEQLAQIVVKSADATVPDQTIDVRGEGVTTTLIVDPDVLSFGNVVVNTTKTLSIAVSNNSEEDGRITYGGEQNVKLCTSGVADPSTFCILLRDRTIGTDGSFELRSGESTTMEVQFTPVIAGTRERGSFTLSACDSPACQTEIRLDGLGIESGFRCNPASLDFGQVNPGSCLTNTVSCENIANEQVTVVSWGLVTNGGVPSSEDFETEPPQVQVLNEGDTVDVDITYCPQTLGEDVGTLGIETDNRDQRLRNIFVPLTGTGGGPDIEVLPLQLNFGLVSTLAPSRRSVLVTNVGFAPLEVTDIVADTDQTGAFTAPGAAGAVLQPGDAMTITVEFQPTAAGAVDSGLLIRSSDQDEGEVTVRLVGEGIVLPPCNFEVTPANLSFGVIEATRSIRRAFEIRNIGSDQCLLTAVRLEAGTDSSFSLPDGDVMSELIPAGAATTINVNYAPQMSGTHTGSVEFSISSPTSPFNNVALSGTGADSTLLIVPNDLDFGTIGVGCAARARTVQIYNTGATPAQIDSIQLAAPANPAFSITSLPTGLPGMPISLDPGASVEFSVGFRADIMSAFAGAVEINGSFNGQAVTYIVSLQGRGDIDATQIDEFSQLGTPKVDILFVIDFSGSMGQEQTAMAMNFDAFIQFAEAQGLDYQLGVTTTDTNDEMGRLMHSSGIRGQAFGGPIANKIVTPQTQPDPRTVFGINVQARNLTGGSAADEAGFEAAFQALTAPNIVGHNAGFLRQDAVLSLVMVSDEPEQSIRTTDFYINFFLSIKGFRNSNLFSASAIVGDDPGGCNGSGGSASAAPRYIEAANRTGGIFQSICTSDWSRSLEDLSTAAFGFKSRFFLTNQPVISTLAVFIDGVELPATSAGGTVNWSYDFATNSVNFSPFATPEPGSSIRVEYTAECL